MNVVGHERIGVQRALGLGQSLTTSAHVAREIFLTKATSFTIVPALHDVQRNVVKLDARSAGH